MSEYENTDGLLDGADIANEMMKGVPGCLRVRMAMDVLASTVTVEQRNEIELILASYLEEAILAERDFDWDALV